MSAIYHSAGSVRSRKGSAKKSSAKSPVRSQKSSAKSPAKSPVRSQKSSAKSPAKKSAGKKSPVKGSIIRSKSPTVLNAKEKKFNKALVAAKKALDSVGAKFHLHAGTALGAHREHSFIPHDHDIDLAVFYKDIDTPQKVKEIKEAMEENGFEIVSKLGSLKRGHEFQFEYKNGVPLDIFWVYEGEYRNKPYHLISSYYGACDDLKHQTCVWGYRPYRVQTIQFLGNTYSVIPKKTLEDAYGKDWMIPKKFGYEEGLEEGGYKGFLKDYYQPRPTNNKIAFCFLLYDSVKHNQQWVKFFKGDRYPVTSYSIYSHLKMVTENTPAWISRHKIKSIKTGWCEENLVFAWIKLLRKALQDPDNQYFCILSGECIPLYTYDETYAAITGCKKSRVHIDENAAATIETGLTYADQWTILTRREAELLIQLKTTEKGKAWTREIRKKLCPATNDVCFCPDELYPVNWFQHVYGKKYDKYIVNQQTTFTYWDGVHTSPVRFNSVKMAEMRKKICKSGSLFARKFNSKAARELALSCGQKK